MTAVTQSILFTAGEGGYRSYRIPALIRSANGVILAFCEARRERGDAAAIDMLLRRSEDGGRTWTNPRMVVDGEGHTAGNPAPVVDRTTGRVTLLYCHNLREQGHTMICRGEAPRTVWKTWSDDDGASWSDPVEITPQVKRPEWTWYATGPCHGIQLESGRLVVPCDHVVAVNMDRHADPHYSHLILSDDGGDTWRIGAIAPEGTNECVAVQLSHGDVYLNARNGPRSRFTELPVPRVFARSRDGGESFYESGRDDALIEPICQASLERVVQDGEESPERVVFSNPHSATRERLTLHWSRDNCRTWTEGTVLHPGPAAYSDLCALPDWRVLCLYERGDTDPYECLALADIDVRPSHIG